MCAHLGCPIQRNLIAFDRNELFHFLQEILRRGSVRDFSRGLLLRGLQSGMREKDPHHMRDAFLSYISEIIREISAPIV